ncbi:group II intron reverse transcriptase/maturase [Dehalobacter sp. DCM]|uniref:group II intron reverse transcriptase/maturase n=1 Tax=Dehalobacter sp. DCM TaxID=2907827 RepID=UPI003081A8E0|nr:group II intron reverse transcriptase/maturase [Dehalobacter sp. DCM]
METKLVRIAEIARANPETKFTSLYHYMNKELLQECHRELQGNKAIGIDGVTKKEYEENLEQKLDDLVERLKKKSYRPLPAKRVYIPKGDGKEKRPLGIACYEDKIVQQGLNKILQAVFEPIFLECSFGFRPQLGCHDALKKLNSVIEKGKISYIVDADIKGFFNNVSHEWLIKFMEHTIADTNMIRLIKRCLKAGIVEGGNWEETEAGTPQGSIISPVLGNLYLHYTLDLWFTKVVTKKSRGQASMVRYADDSVFCFQYKDDAERFYVELKSRLAKFGLEIAENKTKIIEFGRFAEENRARRGMGKTETFDFLGFTHYCGKSRQGKFRVKRKTSRKKYRAKVKEFTQWMKTNRHSSIHEIFKQVKAKLEGHYRYYGITDNSRMLGKYRYEVTKTIFKWMNRRSQKRSFDYDRFNKYLKVNPLPIPKIYVNIYG